MLMTKKQHQVRRRSASAKALELKQYTHRVIPNKKKNIIPDVDFQDDQECGIIEDNLKGETNECS
jgi:hypothetical protein